MVIFQQLNMVDNYIPYYQRWMPSNSASVCLYLSRVFFRFSLCLSLSVSCLLQIQSLFVSVCLMSSSDSVSVCLCLSHGFFRFSLCLSLSHVCLSVCPLLSLSRSLSLSSRGSSGSILMAIQSGEEKEEMKYIWIVKYCFSYLHGLGFNFCMFTCLASMIWLF